jgi:hypothetical protein
MKQSLLAFSCSSFAVSIIERSVTVTIGFRVTSEKCPPPSGVSTIVPVAWQHSCYDDASLYTSCKNESMWQLKGRDNNSSGLCLFYHHENTGSEDAGMSILPSIEIT